MVLTQMFPMLDVIVMVHGRQEARATANWSNDNEDVVEWNCSRSVDGATRETILYALANAAVAQFMTGGDIEEFSKMIHDTYLMIPDRDEE